MLFYGKNNCIFSDNYVLSIPKFGKAIKNYSIYSENELFFLLKQSDQLAFEEIYDRLWAKLYAYVYNRIRIREISEEIVQEVFISLWSKRESLTLTASLSSYLYQAVKYQMLNYIKSDRVRSQYATHFATFTDRLFDNSNNELLAVYDLQNALDKSVSKLPAKCQHVFQLSRYQHLSIQDIARQLNISTKTVENHLTYALKHLRASLGEFLSLLIALIASDLY